MCLTTIVSLGDQVKAVEKGLATARREFWQETIKKASLTSVEIDFSSLGDWKASAGADGAKATVAATQKASAQSEDLTIENKEKHNVRTQHNSKS